MILDELSRLERFRRVAKAYEIPLSKDILLPHYEISYLRAALNARVYLDAESWMLPSWAYLTLKDINKDEEMITELANVSYLNWSNIGGVGASRYGIIDSRGLMTARFDYGSIDFWLLDGESIIYPALLGKDDSQLQLISSEDQLYEWKAHLKSVEFDRLIYHVTKEKKEFIYNEIILRNHNLEKATFTFFVALRPMSVFGFEPIELAEYDDRNRTVMINDYLSLILSKNPTAVIMSENYNGELPHILMVDSTRTDIKTESSSGQAIVLLKYDIILPPTGSEHIFFVSPLASGMNNEELFSLTPSIKDRDVSVNKWFAFSDNRTDTTFPDESLDLAFSQATVSLVIQALSVMFPDDSHLASLNWRERMRILLALVRSGCIDVAKHVATDIIERIQIPERNLDLSLYSPILWGLLQFSDHSITDFAQKNSSVIRKLTLGVLQSVRLMTSNVDGDEPLQSYTVMSESIITDLIQTLWNLAALRSAQAYYSYLQDKELVNDLAEILDDIWRNVSKITQDINHARWPKSDDPAMHGIEDKILDLLSTVSQLRFSGLDHAFLETLSNKVTNRRVIHNLWKIFRPREQYSSHLALRLAHYYTMTKQREKVESLLRRAIEFFTEDYLLPEFVNIHSLGGDEGIGASVIAAADLILLLRDMALIEEESNLVLLPGIPNEWFTAKKPLVINNLPTMFGPAHVEIGPSANQHQIEVNLEELPEELEFHVPSSVPLPMIKAYGATIVGRTSKVSSPFLRVVPHSNEIVLTFHK
ncbi:hypothetical protein EU527_12465 [Candidatus Thorarchaeota archaeon]|nr:MAG: hypothetical protein EU527_12465 [Candidatus Thorarchaeota archaeon]